MKTDSCLRYLEDPDANAGHLAECEECRALFGDTELPTKPIDVPQLPLATWEGASHRSWPLVLAGFVVALAAAAVLCLIAGMTPLRVVESSFRSVQSMRAFVFTSAAALRAASMGAQIAFFGAFIVVNAVLFALLRRSPRGIDA
ncbi:MAG TPA: hypothetical protein VII75_12165 [Thermoanaerobaculia bacterium]|nr:hypothetical protein [Thermoanaerobaculia bacterium]